MDIFAPSPIGVFEFYDNFFFWERKEIYLMHVAVGRRRVSILAHLWHTDVSFRFK
jgi:hypothetical protein